MEKIHANDIAFGNTIDIEGDKNIVKESKFIPLKGICALIKNYKMNESMVITWKYYKGQPDAMAILTDPYKETNNTVDFDSFSGKPISGDNRNIYVYEVSIQVEDLRVDGETNTCLDQSYSECVHTEVQNMMKRVCN